MLSPRCIELTLLHAEHICRTMRVALYEYSMRFTFYLITFHRICSKSNIIVFLYGLSNTYRNTNNYAQNENYDFCASYIENLNKYNRYRYRYIFVSTYHFSKVNPRLVQSNT